MKHLIFFTLALSLIFSSCGPSVRHFNDAVVDNLDAAVDDYNGLSDALDKDFDDDNYDNIKSTVSNVVDSLTKRLDNIKMLQIPSGGEDFQARTVDYIETLINAAKTFEGYSIMSNEEVTTEELEEIGRITEEAEKDFNTKFANVQKAQEQFAAAKKLRLEDK